MAEGSTTHENSENKINEIVKNNQKYFVPTFNNFDLFCILFSFGILLADISTDIILVIQYSLFEYIIWAVSTFMLMVLPAAVMQLLSLRWHKLDEQISTSHYIFHACFLGIIRRYYTVLRSSFEARRRKDLLLLQRLCRLQNDLCVLMLLRAFILSAPQLIFQFYIIFYSEKFQIWTGVSIISSACSIIWALTAYAIVIRKLNGSDIVLRWSAVILQTTWQIGILIARFTSMVLFAFTFHYWFFLVIGLHWIGLTLWTMFQENNFLSDLWEDKICNGIIGVVYCFSYFNICENCSRKRVFTFYLIIVTQNVACLVLVITLNFLTSVEIIIVTSVLIIGGTVIGIISLFLYFTILHPSDSKSCCLIFHDIEMNTSQKQNDISELNFIRNANKLRTLKHLWTIDRHCMARQNVNISFQGSPRSDDGCTDKKLLLENWIARSGTPTFASVPISQDPIEIEANNTFDGVEFHTILNTPDTSYEKNKTNDSYQSEKSPDEKLNSEKQKRRGICSPTDLSLQLLQENEENKDVKSDTSSLTSQKRRGICSSDQLVLDFTNIDLLTNVDDDVKLKRRPIYSVGSSLNSDLCKNVYNVKSMKYSDDKSIHSNIKPEEYVDVASEVLSAHDYENICAVNIARERWGIRSWEGYTDIETYLHDDSTVRDRRRDTLTSTVTGTSASSEISLSDIASSPPPIIPNRKPRLMRTRQDDYLDTLVYDLVDCDKRRVHFLEYNEEQEAESNVFVAKPYVVDQHGMMFPLNSALEPIEELEEPVLINNDCGKQKTQSKLVSTIDEIRRGNDTDSPRHVYHRTENIWDDEMNLVNNLVCNKEIHKIPVSKTVVKSLWNNSGSKLSNSGMEDIRQMSKELEKSKIQVANENNIVYNKTGSNSIETHKKINTLSNLRSPKSENTNKVSPKKLYEIDNVRSKKESKPRRKFSLLREKFEPKVKQDDLLNCSSAEMGSTVNLIDDVKSAKFTTSVITKVVQWNNGMSNQNKDDSDFDGQVTFLDQDCNNATDRSTLASLRDKRNIFLKQVLSPPKFSSKKCHTFNKK